MEFKKNIKNELLKRHEVSGLVEAEKNPGFDEMRKKLSEKLSKPEENIDIYGIQGKFGRKTFLVKAYVYDSMKNRDEMVELRKTQKKKKEEAKTIADEKKAGEEAKKAEEEAKKKADEEAKTAKVAEPVA